MEMEILLRNKELELIPTLEKKNYNQRGEL